MDRKKILLVDDSSTVLLLERMILSKNEYEVVTARDGVEGIEKARAFHPDLVLCDLGLPRLDGYEVARAIRADPALAGIYLVAVTGYASSADQRRAADAGFNRHLAKPVPLDVIEEVLITAPRVTPSA